MAGQGKTYLTETMSFLSFLSICMGLSRCLIEIHLFAVLSTGRAMCIGIACDFKDYNV